MIQAKGAAGQAIVRLTLSDFRCYAFLRLEVDPRPVVLTGANGAGKTNILEALSFLAPGRGLRRTRLSDVTRREAGSEAPWAVAARLERLSGTGMAMDEMPTAVEIGTGRDAGSERRLVRIDGQPARSQAALSEVTSALWLTPAMDRLFSDGAAGRRRFLDRLVLGIDPAHAARASAYEHALRERARLLKSGRYDPAWLGVLEERMAEGGVEMAGARKRTVARLNQACAEGIGPFPAAHLTVEGSVENSLGALEPPEAEVKLRDALAASRRADAESGGAAQGPHRSDLLVRHAGKDQPAEHCSTGEQKAVLIAIVLGQARIQADLRGSPPILLLDEVTAHLDRARRIALFDELCVLGTQSWLTGTDDSLFADLGERGQFFRVNDAVVTRA
ncbi:DNA replication/repair protein RecF [Telmatospirillum siberiense]|uniref:DNA replication and repair protein RecF n=1 Tax=Telmatospirillum siberiense TaxID=382514 RepID=A0A2N3PSJ5_9PROT|nr:DNA replication/repair protein RecF [Telmatospirillum siberiense]PKU23346.1 DNA replication/repair protein RecF [Telmatospirillum siberiense]